VRGKGPLFVGRSRQVSPAASEYQAVASRKVTPVTGTS
jgi:hypothetical protein